MFWKRKQHTNLRREIAEDFLRGQRHRHTELPKRYESFSPSNPLKNSGQIQTLFKYVFISRIHKGGNRQEYRLLALTSNLTRWVVNRTKRSTVGKTADSIDTIGMCSVFTNKLLRNAYVLQFPYQRASFSRQTSMLGLISSHV